MGIRGSVLPLGLADIPAGPLLAAALDGVDRRVLTGPELAAVMIAERRLSNRYMAASLDSMVELGLREVPLGPSSEWDGDPASLPRREHPGEFAAEEPRAILHLTPGVAEAELEGGWQLQADFPAVMADFRAGLLDWPRARLFPETLINLTREQLDIITARVLPQAARLTTTALKARLRAEAMAIDAAWHARNYKERVQAPLRA